MPLTTLITLSLGYNSHYVLGMLLLSVPDSPTHSWNEHFQMSFQEQVWGSGTETRMMLIWRMVMWASLPLFSESVIDNILSLVWVPYFKTGCIVTITKSGIKWILLNQSQSTVNQLCQALLHWPCIDDRYTITLTLEIALVSQSMNQTVTTHIQYLVLSDAVRPNWSCFPTWGDDEVPASGSTIPQG